MSLRSTATPHGVLAALLITATCGYAQETQPAKPQLLSTGWMLVDAAAVHDGGDAISRAGYATADWKKAVVPGTVLTSLVADGVYPEPLYGENNRPDKIPESLARATYWYR